MVSYFTGVYGLPPSANLTVVETEAGAPNGYAAPGMMFLAPRSITKQVGSKILAYSGDTEPTAPLRISHHISHAGRRRITSSGSR